MNSNPVSFCILKSEHVIILKAVQNTKNSHFKFCLPSSYNYQIPLFIKVSGDFDRYTIITEKNHNYVIRFKLNEMKKNEEAEIKLDYWVISKRSKYDKIPKKIHFSNYKKIPEKYIKWLKSTKSVQSENILIRATSKFLKRFTKNSLKFVKRVMFWIAYHRSVITWAKMHLTRNTFIRKNLVSDKFFYPLEDAISALIFGGTCIGKANLAAAILRSQNIPARILIATNTTGYYNEKYWLDSQHYLLEFYIPDYGWIRTQSGRSFSFPHENIILRIVDIDEENIAGNGLSKKGGCPTWFWFEDKKINFGISKRFNLYKIPKTEKTGFPIIRGYKENKLKLDPVLAEELFKLTREAWELFTKKINLDHKKIVHAYEFQEKTLEHLKKDNIQKAIEYLRKSKNEYLKL